MAYEEKNNNHTKANFFHVYRTGILSIIISIISLMLCLSHDLPTALASTSISDSNLTLTADGINQTTSNFLTYNNSAFGIKIQYPASWEILEHFIRGIFITEFVSPPENSSDRFPENVNIAIERIIHNNKTLDYYTTEAAKLLNTSQEVKIIGSEKTTWAGNPANKLIHMTKLPFTEDDVKLMQVYTVKNDKAYVITYTAEPTKYDRFLPIAQKMMDSFEFMNLSTTSAGNMTGTPAIRDSTSSPPCEPGPGEEQRRIQLPDGSWSKCFAPSPLS